MVEYYAPNGFSRKTPPRWTYRKTFAAVTICGLVMWAGVISVVHALLT
jgi:hypothetical protein